jgi:hypothetical protein
MGRDGRGQIRCLLGESAGHAFVDGGKTGFKKDIEASLETAFESRVLGL